MDKKLKFESVMQELETIIKELDSSLGLEESLEKFERGMALAKVAEARLQTIENEFVKIQEKFKKAEESESIAVVETIVTETTTITEAKTIDGDEEVDLSTLPF